MARSELRPLRSAVRPSHREWRATGPVHPISLSLAIAAFTLGGTFTLLSALKTPELIAAGWPDPSLTHELEQAFDHYDAWPQLLQSIGRIAAAGFLLAGGVLLMLARRGSSIGHVARAALGMIALLLAAGWTFDFCGHLQWSGIAGQWNEGQVGPGLTALLDQLQTHNGRPMIVILLSLISGIILLAWPRQHREEATTT